MGAGSAAGSDGRSAFLAFYEDALPHVYGYLSARCGNRAVAEDLTAAVRAWAAPPPAPQARHRRPKPSRAG